MSIRLMTAAWSLKLSSTDKLVLLALADWSNDDGLCWPSMAQLADKSGLTDRAIRTSVGRLVLAGHLTRNEVAGKGVRYTVHPGTSCPPEARSPRKSFPPEPASPRNETTETPERRSANTSVTTNTSQKTTSSSRAGASDAGRYHRLPEGWTPTKALPEALAAKVTKWPPGKLQDELEAMRGWAANAKNENGKGKKLCWDTAWHGWLRRADDDWRAKPANRNGANCNGLGRTASAAISVFGEPERQAPRPPPAELRRIGVG
ncbi:helix-turn-helix domain-containing protein [Sphingomonas xinjiangensis]|uniref:Helix-turn-helix domain-containing protein n=1 Tax=Sphingomonas xinjiangensis TaxID=643568 RepID=A0A840YEX3_9SPHN|nr:helix-turn-helix domain-containing protein [Sphingomonas xinjiangensis]MBB5709318.1 hypothetical protein [Sphingomonas xinjiangensis]